MGYLFALAACFACHRAFSFNPDLVPSIVIGGVREPVCEDCVALVNPRRVAAGLEPIEILPGAYEPAEEWME